MPPVIEILRAQGAAGSGGGRLLQVPKSVSGESAAAPATPTGSGLTTRPPEATPGNAVPGAGAAVDTAAAVGLEAAAAAAAAAESRP